jgi:type II secretory pathway pseudopilin PulG
MMNKKAAMFGLDARIALAIFGALSVISGAALYSAIQNSKATAFYTQTKEIAKATEQFLLDTGEILPNVDTYSRDIRQLVKNEDSKANWNGPYINCEKGSTSDTYYYLYCNGYDGAGLSTYIRKYADNTNIIDVCTSTNCDLWVMYHVGAPKKAQYESLFDAMDERFDGNNGRDTGDLKLYVNGSTVYMIMKIMPFESYL